MGTLMEDLQARIESAVNSTGTFDESLQKLANLYGVAPGSNPSRIIPVAADFDASITSAPAALNYLLNNPTKLPTLGLDFINNQTLDNRITFTRALNTATYFDSAGVLTTANANVARFDYDPATLAPRGLLIEEARTNSIRNNTMQGAVAGTPGTLPTNWPSPIASGISQEIVGVGTENGINYIDFRFFTATTATGNNFVLSAESALQIAAANGQSWASSWFVKVIAAPLPFTTYTNRIRLNDSGGTGVGQIDTVFTPTSTLTRYTSAGTIAAATTAFVQPQIRFGMTIGQAYDVTVRIGLPQLEQGAFATSVIPTTTTALTRNADVASVNTLNPWYNASEGTLFGEFSSYASVSRAILSINDGTLNNRIQFFANAGDPYSIASRLVSGGTQTNPANTGSIAVGAIGKAAIAYAVGTNQSATSVNGGVPTTSSPAAIAVGVNTLELGKANSLTALSGHLRRVAYYPRRLSNAELQAITA